MQGHTTSLAVPSNQAFLAMLPWGMRGNRREDAARTPK